MLDQFANVTLSQLVEMLRTFINSRPGFESADYYGAPAAWRADTSRAQQQRRDALHLLSPFETAARYSGANPDGAADYRAALLLELTHGGRLSLDLTPEGKPRLSYCAGQYYPTEYRGAACRVLAGALWNVQREDCPHLDGDGLRKSFSNWFGRGIAGRWFK